MRKTTTALALVDANVFVYAIGRPHPMKAPCSRIIRLAASSNALFTDAEVFQELLHRYMLIGAWEKVRDQVGDLMSIFEGRTESIHATDVSAAGELHLTYPWLAARDLIHVAVAQRLGAQYVVTADKGFNAVRDVQRLDPMGVDEWGPEISQRILDA